MNIDRKILNKMLAKQIQKYLKGSHTMIKWDLFQGCKDFFNIWFVTDHKSVNMIHHINKWRIKITWSSQ